MSAGEGERDEVENREIICYDGAGGSYPNISWKVHIIQTSQELRMLSRSLCDCKVTVSNSQLVTKLLSI